MTAQEWKKWWGSFDEWPESGSIAADNFYITAIENADAIIRAQQERIERLTAKIAELKVADDQEYKKVIDDALVVANIGAATGDAKADVHKLICWEIDVALDPRVSKRAADLIRLADQEAIERHTRKQIYRELYEIRYEPDKLLCKIERECAPDIQQKYGVE